MADIGTATLDLKNMMRGTTTMKTAAGLTSLTEGTLFYDETLNSVWEWNGATWQSYGPMTPGGGGTGTLATQVQGNSAAAVADVGNPVKTGGKYNSTAPTYTNGQRGDTQIDASGNTFVSMERIPISGQPGSINRARATLNSVSPGVIAAAGDYAAGDVLNQSTTVGVPWQLPGFARLVQGGALVNKAYMTLSVAGVVARFRVFLFNVLPTVVQNDNVALLLDLDDRASALGYIDFPAMQTTGSSEYSFSEADIQWIGQAAAATNLWFFVQTLDAFTNESAGMTMDIFFSGVQS